MPDKVTIYCSGGCGRSVSLRKSKVRPADYYVCDSREDRGKCMEALPPVPPDMIAVMELNASAHFTGITYKKPAADDIAAVARANRILRLGTNRPDQAELSVVREAENNADCP